MLDQLKATTRFENDGEKSRLIIEMAGELPIIDFQVDMIRNNRIPGLLPLELRRADSKILLYYDVTGKWQLKDLLDNRKFSGPEFVTLLDRFIQTLIGAEAYLLEISQFVLDEDRIFIDGNMEPRLLYLPIKGNQNIHSRFKDLLLQLVVYRARLKDDDSSRVLSGILNSLKREDFNLYAFQKTLRGIENTSDSGNAVPESAAGKRDAVPNYSGPMSLGALIPLGESSPPATVTPKVISQKKESVGAPAQSKVKISVKTVTDYETKMKVKPSAVLAIILFQCILAAGVFFGFESVYAMTEDINTAYGAMALMVFSLDGLVLKNLLRSENRVAVQIPVKRKVKGVKEPSSPSGDQGQLRVPQPCPVNFDKQLITNADIPKTAAYDTELLSPMLASDLGSNDTVVLSAQPAAPYLARKGPVQEIIRLKQPSLVLGRQADMADYVISDPAIGRMHAELSWVNNLCQIRDMNSKNGTFVNGQRLAGPQPVNLFVGDEIKLGSLEYTLVQD